MEKVPYIELFSSAQKYKTNFYEQLSNNHTSNNFYKRNAQMNENLNQRSSSVNTKTIQRPFTTNYYDQAIKICFDNRLPQGILSPTFDQLKKFNFIKTTNCHCNYQNTFHKHVNQTQQKKQPLIETKQIQQKSQYLKINLNQIKEQANNESQHVSTTNYMDNTSQLLSKEGTDRYSKNSKSKRSNCLSPRQYLKQTAQFNSKSSIKNDICLQKTNSKKIVSFKQISNTVINSQILDPQRASIPSSRNQSKNSQTILCKNKINKLIQNLQRDLNRNIDLLSFNDKEALKKQWMVQELQQIKQESLLLNKQFVFKLDQLLSIHENKSQKASVKTLQQSKSTGQLKRKKLFVTQSQF